MYLRNKAGEVVSAFWASKLGQAIILVYALVAMLVFAIFDKEDEETGQDMH